MAQGVTYADLRFVRSPPEKSQPAGSDGDGEVTYENVRETQIREEAKAPRDESQETPGLDRWSWSWVRRRRVVRVAVLGFACLVLLASAAGLGIRYWLVSEQLHQAARRHAEERLVLAGRIRTLERQLDEARGGLSELWADRNRTAQRLQESEAELNRSRNGLALLRQEKQQVEAALRQATVCPEMAPAPVCCPRGWEFFQQKCLWVSPGRKTWEKGREDCERKASRLVILETSQEVGGLWNTLMGKEDKSFGPRAAFWIGLRQEERDYPYPWLWLDGSSYMGAEQLPKCGYIRENNRCGMLAQGALQKCSCSDYLQYICETAAMPAQPAQTPGRWH